MSDNLLEKFYLVTEEKSRLELIELMLNEYEYYLDLVLSNVLDNKELRNNAYILNILSKKKRVNEYLKVKFTKKHFEILVNDGDSKTRKNTYIFMGNFINKDYLLDLIKALKNETTNYCISSLILSLGNYKIKNIDEIMNKYQEILDKKLANKEIEEVHYKEIVNSINKVLGKNTKFKMHTFTGFKSEQKLFLTCMEPLINASYFDIKKYFPDASKYKNGVFVVSEDLDSVYKIRTFYEALLVHKNSSKLSLEALKGNIKSFLSSDFLYDTHLEKDAFLYRIEYITSKNKEEKLKMYNEINELINKEFKNKYYNNPSNYEFEIRIIDNEDSYDVFYKLYTYKDSRFDYRKKDLPASINPVSASIMLHEVEKYLTPNSKVLDPFCGTATMLIERNYLSKSSLVGVDISSVAIDHASTNTKELKLDISLVNKNCLDYQGYFDEIISNMPYGNRVGTHLDNELLYSKFLHKLPNLLNDNGVAILLTSEITLIKQLLKNDKKLKLVKDIYTETGGLTPHLFIIKKV